jgi:hypothetical protein
LLFFRRHHCQRIERSLHIQKQIPLFQGYEEIVLFFDNDDAGRKATEEAATVLPVGKVKIARLEQYKDASDALQDDNAEAIRKAIWNAEQYRPDGIVEGKSLQSLVTTPLPPADHDYPFNCTALGIKSLQLLLQDLDKESPRSVVNLLLTYSPKENGSGTWHLRNQIVEPHLD